MHTDERVNSSLKTPESISPTSRYPLDPLQVIRASSDPMPALTWRDLRTDAAAYDIIGDIHSCADELEELIRTLGYEVTWSQEQDERTVKIVPPHGRKLVLLGDLVDRGPKSADTLRLAIAVIDQNCGYVIMGNHDIYLAQWMRGANLPINPGIAQTINQLSRESEPFLRAALATISALPTYLWLDGGRLCVSHAGLRADLLGRDTPEAFEHAINGDEPIRNATQTYDPRLHWAASYGGETSMVYGHFRLQDALWVNNTMCIDTACVYGGKLTALRWPERELVSVSAHERYTYTRARGRCIPPGTILFS